MHSVSMRPRDKVRNIVEWRWFVLTFPFFWMVPAPAAVCALPQVAPAGAAANELNDVNAGEPVDFPKDSTGGGNTEAAPVVPFALPAVENDGGTVGVSPVLLSKVDEDNPNPAKLSGAVVDAPLACACGGSRSMSNGRRGRNSCGSEA